MTDKTSNGDRELWARLVRESEPAGDTPEPDPMTLAAWLDGRQSEGDGEAVESWLAADPEAAAHVRVLREGMSENETPAALIARAQGLVGAERSRAVSFDWSELFRTPAFGAALAIVIVAAFGGFQLGAATFERIAETEAVIGAELWPAYEPDEPSG